MCQVGRHLIHQTELKTSLKNGPKAVTNPNSTSRDRTGTGLNIETKCNAARREFLIAAGEGEASVGVRVPRKARHGARMRYDDDATLTSVGEYAAAAAVARPIKS